MKKLFAAILAAVMLAACVPAAVSAKSGPTVLAVYTPVMTDNGMAVLNGKAAFSGEKVKGVWFYYKKASDADYRRVRSNPKSLGKYQKQVTGLSYGTAYVCYMKVQTTRKTYRTSVRKFVTPKKRTWTAYDPIKKTTAAKYAYLFGSSVKPLTYKLGNPPPGYYLDAEARHHMTKITVKTWRLRNGKKISSSRTFLINKKLAANVKAIFKELYKLRFPIADVTTYKFRAIGGPGLKGSRSISKHSFGCAIDINRYVNGYYIGYDGRNRKSPYYITPSVVKVFKKYGWVWDGEAPKYKDTMHFQYLKDITVTP